MEATFLKSILDNDFYKFTMQHAVIRLFPKAKVRYGFINRGKHKFPAGFADLLRHSVDAMADLRLTKEEKNYLSHYCHYLDPTYLDFCRDIVLIRQKYKFLRKDQKLKLQLKDFGTVLFCGKFR